MTDDEANEIEKELAKLEDDIEPPPGWQERVLARIAAGEADGPPTLAVSEEAQEHGRRAAFAALVLVDALVLAGRDDIRGRLSEPGLRMDLLTSAEALARAMRLEVTTRHLEEESHQALLDLVGHEEIAALARGLCDDEG